METYKIIYSFEVIEKLKEGKTVFSLDRKHLRVCEMRELVAGEFVDMLKKAETERDRFEFWTVEKVATNEE